MLHHQIKLLFRMLTFVGFLAIMPNVGLTQAPTPEETKDIATELEKVKAELAHLKSMQASTNSAQSKNDITAELEEVKAQLGQLQATLTATSQPSSSAKPSPTLADNVLSFISTSFAAGVIRLYMHILTLNAHSLQSGLFDIPILMTSYYAGNALAEKLPHSAEILALLSAYFITVKESLLSNAPMPDVGFYTSMNAGIIALGFAWHNFDPRSFFSVSLTTTLLCINHAVELIRYCVVLMSARMRNG